MVELGTAMSEVGVWSTNSVVLLLGSVTIEFSVSFSALSVSESDL